MYTMQSNETIIFDATGHDYLLARVRHDRTHCGDSEERSRRRAATSSVDIFDGPHFRPLGEYDARLSLARGPHACHRSI